MLPNHQTPNRGTQIETRNHGIWIADNLATERGRKFAELQVDVASISSSERANQPQSEKKSNFVDHEFPITCVEERSGAAFSGDAGRELAVLTLVPFEDFAHLVAPADGSIASFPGGQNSQLRAIGFGSRNPNAKKKRV